MKSQVSPEVVEGILEVVTEIVDCKPKVDVEVVDGKPNVDVEVVPFVEVTCSGLQLLTRSMVLICSDLHSLISV